MIKVKFFINIEIFYYNKRQPPDQAPKVNWLPSAMAPKCVLTESELKEREKRYGDFCRRAFRVDRSTWNGREETQLGDKKKEAVGNGAMGAKIRRTAVASLIQKKKGKKTKQKTRERETERFPAATIRTHIAMHIPCKLDETSASRIPGIHFQAFSLI